MVLVEVAAVQVFAKALRAKEDFMLVEAVVVILVLELLVVEMGQVRLVGLSVLFQHRLLQTQGVVEVAA